MPARGSSSSTATSRRQPEAPVKLENEYDQLYYHWIVKWLLRHHLYDLTFSIKGINMRCYNPVMTPLDQDCELALAGCVTRAPAPLWRASPSPTADCAKTHALRVALTYWHVQPHGPTRQLIIVVNIITYCKHTLNISKHIITFRVI